MLLMDLTLIHCKTLAKRLGDTIFLEATYVLANY